MTRSALIEVLAARFPELVRDDAKAAVKAILEALKSCLTEGNRIEIRGFGTFETTQHRPKTGRNPKTGEPIYIPAKARPHFKPSKEMRQRVTAGSKTIGDRRRRAA